MTEPCDEPALHRRADDDPRTTQAWWQDDDGFGAPKPRSRPRRRRGVPDGRPATFRTTLVRSPGRRTPTLPAGDGGGRCPHPGRPVGGRGRLPTVAPVRG